MEQDDQFQQQPIMYAGNPASYNESILKYQLDTEDFLEDIENKLLGKRRVYDPKTNSIVVIDDKDTEALINMRGWSRVKAHLEAGVDRVFSLTDLEDDQVRKFTIDIGRNLIDMLYLHWEDYGIKSVTDASEIVRIVTMAIYANLRKSHLGTYLKFLTTTHSHHEQVNYMGERNRGGGGNEPKKQSFINKLMGRGV